MRSPCERLLRYLRGEFGHALGRYPAGRSQIDRQLITLARRVVGCVACWRQLAIESFGRFADGGHAPPAAKDHWNFVGASSDQGFEGARGVAAYQGWIVLPALAHPESARQALVLRGEGAA